MIITTNRSPSSSNLFNVKQFGAKGDGFTDDTNAVQAAINAAQSATIPGGILYFPKGSYLLNGTAEWQSVAVSAGNMTIRGDGVGLSKLIQGDAQYPIIAIGPSANVSGHVLVEHIQFVAAEDQTDDGQDSTTPKGSLLAVSGNSDNMIISVTIQNCLFESAMRRCIWLKNVKNASVASCTLGAESGDDHITAVKPVSGTWSLHLGYNIYLDENDDPAVRVVDTEFGDGGGAVILYGSASALGDIVFSSYAAVLASAASEEMVNAPDINGRRRWWYRDDGYDVTGKEIGTDYFENAGGIIYVLQS